MERLIVAAALVAVAVVVALALQRRRKADPEAQAPRFSTPDRLDRADFHRPDADWLVVAFTSATCSTCASVVQRMGPLASDQVAIQEVEVTERPDLHQRYDVDAVPLVVVADAAGSVRAHAFGPQTTAGLWSLVADARGSGAAG